VPWEWPVGAGCAFLLALITTPAGVSGAVLLLPIQLSILHVPSPAVMLLAPILLAAGLCAYEVAPATLTATFLTSIDCLLAARYIQTGIQQPPARHTPHAITR
jgi:hypothetical protein